MRKNHVAKIIRFHKIVLCGSQEGKYFQLKDLTVLLDQKYVGVGSAGPLFFTHYSFMGFDPRGIDDRYTNYFDYNRAIALINQGYCMDNPINHMGYSEKGWGLTASDGPWGYQPHEPSMHMDSGTLTPTGAISSFLYTSEESMKVLK